MTNTEPTDAESASAAAAAAAAAAKDIMVKLVSGDDHTFELPLSAAKHSRLVRDALNINENGEIERDEDAEDDDDEEEENPEDGNSNNANSGGAGNIKPVDCLRVEGNCLEKVVEFLKHYDTETMIEIPVPLPANTFEECMTQEWYRQFVSNMDRESLFQLLTAANYMNIKPLLDLACLRVTFEVTGKSADEIRTYLKLPELTAEEEALARENHPWIFEENN